jgi:hypothetical protein
MTAPIRVWRAPLVLATVSLFGLLVALVGDGAADAAGWIALAIPIIVACTFVAPAVQRRRASRRDATSFLET